MFVQGVSKRFIGCMRNLEQDGIDVGAPSYSVGTEPCTLAVEPGSFFYTDAGHLQLCMYNDLLSNHYSILLLLLLLLLLVLLLLLLLLQNLVR